jgi:hypothetical protein
VITLSKNVSASENVEIRPVVKGIRTCLKCKGICHEDSVRYIKPSGLGMRRHYFCRVDCMLYYFANQMNVDIYEGNNPDFKEWLLVHKMKGEFPQYEYVDCITR